MFALYANIFFLDHDHIGDAIAMSTGNHITNAAERLLSAHRQRQRIILPRDYLPTTLADAYAIQDTVAAHLWPDRIGAWKTGAPSPDAEPIAAPIGSELIFISGSELPAATFHMLGIEGELAYRLGADLPQTDTPYTLEQVSAAIASIHAAIEIVDTRLADWETAGAHCKLADNQSNGGLALGDYIADWRSIEPTQQRALLYVNQQCKADTVGGNAAGDPLRLLVWLANHCAARGKSLRAGDVITTGTHTGLVFVNPGDAVSVEFPGIGSVKIAFTS